MTDVLLFSFLYSTTNHGIPAIELPGAEIALSQMPMALWHRMPGDDPGYENSMHFYSTAPIGQVVYQPLQAMPHHPPLNLFQPPEYSLVPTPP
jgi:hypothetical protein